MTSPFSRFDRSNLRGDPLRSLLLEMMEAGLDAVEPSDLVANALADMGLEGSPATVIAIGKAAPAMARAERALSEVTAGLIVSDHVEPVPAGVELVIAGHPLPDERSVEAAARAFELLAGTPNGSPVIFLISGGGSSLVELPAPGLTLYDLRQIYRSMISASMPITTINAVRTALSAVKGGRLAAAAAHLEPVTLVLSDVGRAPAATVASGPTAPPRSSDMDLEAELREHRVWDGLPEVARRLLASDREAPLSNPHPLLEVGNGLTAARAAASRAERLGWDASVVENELSGDAADAGRGFLRRTEPLAIIWGETTVELGTSSGVGGRNQEAALAAAIEGEGEDGWLLTALATDGVDGNSQAAGAIVDGGTADRIRATGLDPVACLEEHDSHPALAAAGDLLVTGPTGTNVADLWIVARGIG